MKKEYVVISGRLREYIKAKDRSEAIKKALKKNLKKKTRLGTLVMVVEVTPGNTTYARIDDFIKYVNNGEENS